MLTQRWQHQEATDRACAAPVPQACACADRARAGRVLAKRCSLGIPGCYQHRSPGRDRGVGAGRGWGQTNGLVTHNE